MTVNEKAKRIFTAVEHGLIGAGVLAITLFVHTETYKDEVRAEREARCRCKPEISGRKLVASICQAPTNLGPWFHECLYQKEK